jgi:hypothetical protein
MKERGTPAKGWEWNQRPTKPRAVIDAEYLRNVKADLAYRFAMGPRKHEGQPPEVQRAEEAQFKLANLVLFDAASYALANEEAGRKWRA